MKKFALLAVAVALASTAIGFLFAAITHSPPGDWLVVQQSTGRPPKLIALLALIPIFLALILAAVKYFYKKHKRKD